MIPFFLSTKDFFDRMGSEPGVGRTTLLGAALLMLDGQTGCGCGQALTGNSLSLHFESQSFGLPLVKVLPYNHALW